MTDLAAVTRPVTVLQVIESTLGAFFAFVVGFIVLVFGGWIVWEERARSSFPWLASAYAVASSGEICFLAWLKVSLERRLHPIAPLLALRQAKWPILIRPLAASWWFAHFACASATLLMVEWSFSFKGMPWQGAMALGLVFFAAQFMLTNSAMLYLLLSVTAVVSSETLVWKLWGKRILIDLAIMGAAALTTAKWAHP